MQEQEEDIYEGRLPELQKDAQIGWEAYKRGDVEDGPAMAKIRADLHKRYEKALEA